MNDEQTRVAELIREAFRDVVLGDGVGLWQGQGLDDYADDKTLVEYRARDEKNNWSAIPVSQLNRCSSSLSFFDAAGMRFHLPAFLIAELAGTFHQDVVFHLSCFDYDNMTRFALLTGPQRRAVREFLLLRLSELEYDFERPMIQRALREYWTEAEAG